MEYKLPIKNYTNLYYRHLESVECRKDYFHIESETPAFVTAQSLNGQRAWI